MKDKPTPPYHLHGIRVLLFGVLLTALFMVRIDASALSATADSSEVLAYATSVSHGDLLSTTNSYRAQNGLGALTLNSQLNSSSQAKAQHMIDNNYWAHVAPDGTQPWYFFDQAGYSYTAAGENLAYGFATSAAVVDAWMASPTHKANMLGDYADVGFGFVNGASYQGGQNTVVVAHYGKQSTPAPPPPPPAAPAAPVAPTPSTPVESSSPQNTSPLTAPAEIELPATETPPSEEITPAVTESSPEKKAVVPVTVGSAKSINILQSLRLGNAPALALASLTMTVFVATGFALTHRRLMVHAVASGEKFIITHPVLDTTVVAVISILILTTTISRIG